MQEVRTEPRQEDGNFFFLPLHFVEGHKAKFF